MATFDFTCPYCGAVFQAEDEWVGQTGECSECGREMVIRKIPPSSVSVQTAPKSQPAGVSPQPPRNRVAIGAKPASPAEMKKKVKGYFVQSAEDRFTRFRHVKTKAAIRLEEILDVYSVLDMEIVYIKKNEEDAGSVFFSFTYSRDCHNEVTDTCYNMRMCLGIDEDKSIELTDSSGWESDFSEGGKGHLVNERIQLSVSLQDLAEIVKARKLSYKIVTDNREISGALTAQLLIIKGFYNNVFNEDFELEYLYRTI